MAKASSLAAAIESAFDIKVTLVEGHNGVYEVSVDDELIYSNHGQCSQGFPSDEQIVEQIGQFIGVKPKRGTSPESQLAENQDPCCMQPTRGKGDGTVDRSSTANPAEANSNCGCGPESSIPSTGGGCCDPKDSLADGAGCCDTQANNPVKKGGGLLKKLLTGGILLVALALAGIAVAKKAGWYGDARGQVDSVGVASSGVSSTACATPPAKDSLLTELVGTNEAVFALMPCGHEDHTQELHDRVAPAVQKLQAQGKRTDLVVMDPSSPAYARLIELHAAESFPCMAVIGTSCASSLFSDDFSEERLFSAFIAATSPTSHSSCATPCGTQSADSTSDSKLAKSSCCP